MHAQGSLRIYIAGPYTSESGAQIHQNVMKAIDAGLRLWKMGHYPYIPHLTHFVDERAKKMGISMKWEDYIEWDRAWLRLCDAILLLGNSNGANMELEYARQLGKIEFHDLNEVPTLSKCLATLP